LRGYLIPMAVGLLLLNDEGEVLKIAEWPSSAEEAVEEIIAFEEGEVPPTLKRLLGEMAGVTELIVEDADLARSLGRLTSCRVVAIPNNNVATRFRENTQLYAEKLGVQWESYLARLHELSLLLARRKVRKAAEKRDLFVAQAINALDDITKTINLFASRIREWYSLHFPELNDIVEDHREYALVVSKLGHRSNITVASIRDLGISEELANKIAAAAKSSMGADITDFDLEAIRLLSDMTLKLYEARESMEKYIDSAMLEVAPNVRALVGPSLGARLIALAGGLSKLATLPASTVQVLGAEKALFRSLRTGSKPPKHGVIFQHPAIHRAPRWQRGKIARALAAKLAIAARIDAFTGEFRGNELKEQLEERINEIKTLYAKPPQRKPAPPAKQEKTRGRRRRK